MKKIIKGLKKDLRRSLMTNQQKAELKEKLLAMTGTESSRENEVEEWLVKAD